MQHHPDEIPSDAEVLAILKKNGGNVQPVMLLNSLVDNGHEPTNAIRAIQRVIERGLVELGDDLSLVATRVPELIAA